MKINHDQNCKKTAFTEKLMSFLFKIVDLSEKIRLNVNLLKIP